MTCLSLFKEAVKMAVCRLLSKMPEVNDADADATVAEDDLQGGLQAWLIEPRTYRADSGNPVTTSYYQFALDVEPGAWRQCHADAVYARLDDPEAIPLIAAPGASIAKALRLGSKRKLATDLRNAGLVKTDRVIKPSGLRKAVRVWILQPKIVESLVAPEAEVTQ